MDQLTTRAAYPIRERPVHPVDVIKLTLSLVEAVPLFSLPANGGANGRPPFGTRISITNGTVGRSDSRSASVQPVSSERWRFDGAAIHVRAIHDENFTPGQKYRLSPSEKPFDGLPTSVTVRGSVRVRVIFDPKVIEAEYPGEGFAGGNGVISAATIAFGRVFGLWAWLGYEISVKEEGGDDAHSVHAGAGLVFGTVGR